MGALRGSGFRVQGSGHLCGNLSPKQIAEPASTMISGLCQAQVAELVRQT